MSDKKTIKNKFNLSGSEMVLSIFGGGFAVGGHGVPMLFEQVKTDVSREINHCKEKLTRDNQEATTLKNVTENDGVEHISYQVNSVSHFTHNDLMACVQ